ncbi:hypothetical protein PG994_007385 [Apiospora phragmitis]|uniref:CFEM domain-containing protein n=1 Tax=Apiospora phragmitis TaxID=2905665 RepID=A0ABR1V1D7_9PEZI
MKAVLILATTAVAAAQCYFAGEPDCAIPCLTDAIGKVGCASGDIKCQCSADTQTALVPLVAPCLQSKCSAKELGQALQAGQDICSSYAAGKLTFSASAMPSSAAMTTPPSASASATETPITDPLLSIQTSIPSNATASMSMSMSMTMTQSATITMITGSGSGGGSGTSTPAGGDGASSTSPPANAAATQGAAKVVGGVLAGVVGLVVAL